MGAQWERDDARLAEMRRLSLVSYLMSWTFSCLSDLPRARGAARWPGLCARARWPSGWGLARAGRGARARDRASVCARCVHVCAGVWRRAGRGRGRRRPEALPVNVLPV